MSTNEYEQFAKAFRCTVPMAESIVVRIRQRLGRDVPMGELLATIKKIAPTRLTTDEIVKRIQKNGAARSNRVSRVDDEEDGFEPEIEDAPASPRKPVIKRAASTQGQIGELLARNWTRARDLGLKPPSLTADKFVRATQSAVGEPKPTVARVLAAVQKLSKKDVLITPNLVADEIIEADELR